MIVITSGKKYIDIDAYAGIIAYTYLLNSLGKEAIGVSSAEFNDSIPSIIKDINLKLDSFKSENNQKFIILDVSHPEMLDAIVKHEKIIEIIDFIIARIRYILKNIYYN